GAVVAMEVFLEDGALIPEALDVALQQGIVYAVGVGDGGEELALGLAVLVARARGLGFAARAGFGRGAFGAGAFGAGGSLAGRLLLLCHCVPSCASHTRLAAMNGRRRVIAAMNGR